MSTKTSFKRIAAVAAVALTLGGFSAVSAHAVPTADTLAVSSTAVAATSSVQSQVAVTQTFLAQASADAGTVTAALISAPAGNIAVPSFETPTVTGYTDARATRASSAGASMTTVVSSGTYPAYVAATYNLDFTPVVAGTYIVKLIPTVSAGATAYATAQTITYTVAAKAAPTASSTAYMIPAYSRYVNGVGALDTAGGSYTGTINSTTNVSSTSCYADPMYAGAQCAVIRVTMSNASGSTASNLVSGDATDITASISGPGTLALATGTAVDSNNSTYTVFGNNGVPGAGAKATYTSSTVNTYQRTSLTKDLVVYQDGTPGTATVTISTAAGLVIGTKTVVFYGNAAKIATATVASPVIAATSGNTAAITAYVYDANGFAVPGVTLNALSDNTAIASNASATSDSTGKVSFSLTGVAAGVANFKITNAASLTDTTTTLLSGVTSVAVRVGSTSVAAVKWALDSTTYTPGQLGTLSVTLLDASGLPVAPGTYSNIFTAAPTFSLAPASALTLSSGSVTVAAGSSTGTTAYTFNAPISAGALAIKATTGTSLPTAGQAVAVELDAVVTGGAGVDAAQAAQDAANEATDAANAATDAANNAMDSADAATAAAQDAGDKADAALAAITDLATKVSDIATQVSALSAVVAKIAAAVAKISAKVKA